MSGGGQGNDMWLGAGRAWRHPSSARNGATTIDVNERPRAWPHNTAMSSEVMGAKPKNQSGVSWESTHAGIKSAALSDFVGKM